MTDARVIWNNGAILSVQTRSVSRTTLLGRIRRACPVLQRHEDGGPSVALRSIPGIQYSYTRREVNPVDNLCRAKSGYFQYVDLGGPGLTPVGMATALLNTCAELYSHRVRNNTLAGRQRLLDEYNAAGVMATPANSNLQREGD